jgi:hypothetical protein
VLTVVGVGCNSGAGGEAAVLGQDLRDYEQRLRMWAPIEHSISRPLAAVEREQFVDDEVVIETLTPVIGTVRDYVEILEAYEPKTTALQGFHRRYTEIWRAHQRACEKIVRGAETKDYVLLGRGARELREANLGLRDLLAELAQMTSRVRAESSAS